MQSRTSRHYNATTVDAKFEENILGFLVVIPAESKGAVARRKFHATVKVAQELKRVASTAMIDNGWLLAVAFPRANGTGGVLVQDNASDAILLADGTWFYDETLGPGSEVQLLDRFLAAGAPQVAARLQGFFGIVVSEPKIQQIHVITDVVGSCHTYVRHTPEGIAVASSPVLLAIWAPWTLDDVACQEFLQSGIVYEDRTFYREVRKLPPASIHTVKASGITGQQYWSAKRLTPESLPDSSAVDSLWESLVGSARRVARTFSRPVCDLTGGYDSRAVVAGFAASGVPFATTVSGASESADVTVSAQIAKATGLKHLHLNSETAQSFAEIEEAFRFTEGAYDLVEYARVLSLHKRMSQDFDISVNGSFGELARGYWWELLFPHAGRRTLLDADLVARKRYANPEHPSLYRHDLRIPFATHLAEVLRRTNVGLEGFPNTFQLDHAYIYMRMRCWQGGIACSTNRLWPCLSPFMMRTALETVLQSKASLRTRSLMIRKMLSKHAAAFGNIRLELGYPAVPVTWYNVFRFWRILPFYGGKIVQRIGPSRTHRPAPHATSNSGLAGDPGVRQLLDLKSMRLASVLDEDAVHNLVTENAVASGAAQNSQWRQLVTLEYTLKRVDAETARNASIAADWRG